MNRPDDAAGFSASATPTATELAKLVVESHGAEAYLEQAQDLMDWTQHATMMISYDTDKDVLYVDVSDSFGADISSLAAFADETQVSLSGDLAYSYVEVAGFAVLTSCCLTHARENLGVSSQIQELTGQAARDQAQQMVGSDTESAVMLPLSEAAARELLISWTLQAGRAPEHWNDEISAALVTTLSDEHLGEIVVRWMAELSEHGPILPEVVRGVDGAVHLAGQESQAKVSPLRIDDKKMPALLSGSWLPEDGLLELEAVAVSDGLSIRLPLPGPMRPGLRVYAVVDLDGAVIEVELVGAAVPAGLPGIISGTQTVEPGSNARLVGITVRRAEAA